MCAAARARISNLINKQTSQRAVVRLIIQEGECSSRDWIELLSFCWGPSHTRKDLYSILLSNGIIAKPEFSKIGTGIY